MIPIRGIVFTKEKKYNTKNRAFINESKSIKYGEAKNNTTFAFIGSAGGGKTVTMYGIADQFKNAFCTDPKGGAKDAIDFLGVADRWEFYKIRKVKNTYEKFLEINASDLVEGIENILSFKRRLEDKARISNYIREFLSKPEHERTYSNLQTIFFENKMHYVMDDLDPILSQTDSGISLEEACSGRKLIDIVGLSVENRCIALLLYLIIDLKRQQKELEAKTGREIIEPLFISSDDCQTYVTQYTAFGKAFEISFSEGRQFKISSALAGTNRGKLAMQIKGNITNLFVFPSKTEIQSFWEKEKINIDPERLERLRFQYGEKGNFYLHVEENPEESDYLHFDKDFYQTMHKQKITTNTEKISVSSQGITRQLSIL